MKKRVVTFICLLLIAAMLFCSCGAFIEEEDDPKPRFEKETEEGSQTSKPTANTEVKPKKMININGKKASEVIEGFAREYSRSAALDMVVDANSKVDGKWQYLSVELKINQNDMYMFLNNNGPTMEFWGIDGMIYVDLDGKKVKARGDVEDVLGQSVSDLFWGSLPTNIDEKYLDKIDEADIYFYKGSFYFSIYFDEQEAALAGNEEGAYEETFFCDAAGIITAVEIAYDNGSSMNMQFNSYGKPVTIAPPYNAHEFVEKETEDDENGENNDFEGSESIDPEAYQTYLQVCETLESIESYKMFYSINSKPCVIYETDGRDEYIQAVSLNINYSELWLVNGVAYGTKGSEGPCMIGTPTQDVVSAFDTVQYTMDYSHPSVSPAEMSYVIMLDEGDYITVIFERLVGDNSIDKYTYTFCKDMSAIYVKIEYYTLDKLIWTDEYTYSGINSPSRDIIAPTLEGTVI